MVAASLVGRGVDSTRTVSPSMRASWIGGNGHHMSQISEPYQHYPIFIAGVTDM